MKIRILLFLILVIAAVNSTYGQRSLQQFSYGNLQGVRRYGVSANYFDNYEKGGAIDYLKIKRNRNYLKYTLQYRQRITSTEESLTFHFQVSHGDHIRQFGKRIFTRFLIGPELGYENKKSLLMDEQKDFVFAGLHLGLEAEVFLSQRIVFYTSAMQYGHVYIQNIRTDWLLNAGLRLSLR